MPPHPQIIATESTLLHKLTRGKAHEHPTTNRNTRILLYALQAFNYSQSFRVFLFFSHFAKLPYITPSVRGPLLSRIHSFALNIQSCSASFISHKTMARTLLLIALCVLPALVSAVRPNTKPFSVEGRVYCDTCQAGFETPATTYIAGNSLTFTSPNCFSFRSVHFIARSA